jgi:glycosyltransferase involved in cell wall biosynthesis
LKLLIDGIFFQLDNTGIARVWRSLLPYVVLNSDIDVMMLDRGNAPAIDGVTLIPFPSRKLAEQSADDSILIQRVCDYFAVDVFTSTYYSTPISTPMLLIVHDMIPELFGFDLSQRPWMDKELAISFARRHLCVSRNTRDDLLSLYPEICSEQVSVQCCGVDKTVFTHQDASAVMEFRKKYGLLRPYFLFVGSRVQHNGYKNSKLFFDAIQAMDATDFDVFCVGGEEQIEAEVLRKLPHGVKCRRAELSDVELALAYGGARALIYPSLYEGFGLPVIEAMASGCPVITTHHGSLRESAGDSACLISGYSVEEMRSALEKMSEDDCRAHLRRQGLKHASGFSWHRMADTFCSELRALDLEAKRGDYDAFFTKWRALREIQASVDS